MYASRYCDLEPKKVSNRFFCESTSCGNRAQLSKKCLWERLNSVTGWRSLSCYGCSRKKDAWRQENWGLTRRDNDTKVYHLQLQLHWPGLKRSRKQNCHSWETEVIPTNTVFLLPDLAKNASFTKCKSLNGCSLLHTLPAPPVWVSSASSTLS